MARSDLLIDLVKYGMNGNRSKLIKVIEALIAEERKKQHSVLAKKLEEVLYYRGSNKVSNGNFPNNGNFENIALEMIPQKTLGDLILPDIVFQIVETIIKEQHRVDLLRTYGLEPRNKLLLVGPPGNGKTSLAEAIAESLNLPLVNVKYEGIVGTYLGETASRLKKLMDYASTRNCVLFFDEFETLGKERGDTHETGEIKRVVSSLLMQIDNLPSHVIVIAATNHAELLDRAAWRRFQARINIPKPTRNKLEEWFRRFEKKHNFSFGYAPSTLAKKLFGANFAEIEEFGISVLRQHVLSLPDSNVNKIVAKELREWGEKNVNSNSNE